MNEERFILATLKRRLLEKGKYYEKNKDYWPSWIDEVLRTIAEIEADAVLGEDIEAEAQEVE